MGTTDAIKGIIIPRINPKIIELVVGIEEIEAPIAFFSETVT
jgi:hypothetical protein